MANKRTPNKLRIEMSLADPSQGHRVLEDKIYLKSPFMDRRVYEEIMVSPESKRTFMDTALKAVADRMTAYVQADVFRVDLHGVKFNDATQTAEVWFKAWYSTPGYFYNNNIL